MILVTCGLVILINVFFLSIRELGNSRFEIELKDEVLEACAPHGGAVHIFVDMNTPSGNVYVKCPSVTAAVAAVTNLHGRWFGGRVIACSYIPVLNYHSLFPDAMAAQSVVLEPSRK